MRGRSARPAPVDLLQRVALRLLLPPAIYRGARNLLEKARARRGDAEPA